MDLQKQTFLQLIDENKGIIRSLCKSFYPIAEDQNDAFQDIVLQLWKTKDSFRADAGMNTWIYRISLNTLLSKKRQEKKFIETNSLEQSNLFISESYVNDDLELLQLVIHSLRDVDKAIVTLFLEGYKNKEIAQILGLSASNVGTRLNRITSSLKRKFQNHSYAPRKL